MQKLFAVLTDGKVERTLTSRGEAGLICQITTGLGTLDVAVLNSGHFDIILEHGTVGRVYLVQGSINKATVENLVGKIGEKVNEEYIQKKDVALTRAQIEGLSWWQVAKLARHVLNGRGKRQ